MNEAVKRLLAMYLDITASPRHAVMKEYARLFGRLSYDEQGELSYQISRHFEALGGP